MIARIWRGRTRESDQNTYFEYLQRTGLKDYASTSGNRGVWVLRRVYEGKAEFTLISLWDSWDAIKAFAGSEYEPAVYYPEDKKFLLNSSPRSRTPRFCSPAEARRISCDNLPGILHQHSRNGSRHQVRHGSRHHGSHTETRQFAFLVRRERSDPA